jgi:dTDP-4-dehydrorhamnose 3,5-epimerase
VKIVDTALPDVKIFEPRVFGDERGFFQETWNAETFRNLGYDLEFVQDNHSRSGRGILRGLHYQIKQPQGKLVRVTQGSVIDVAVDLRRSSASFGKHVAVNLSGENKRILWVPPGFAHGFYVVTETADFLYKCTEKYLPELERCLLWNDPALMIDWSLGAGTVPTLSAKDAAGLSLVESELFE